MAILLTLRCTQEHHKALATWQLENNLFLTIEFYIKKSVQKLELETEKKLELVWEFKVPLDLTNKSENAKDYNYFILHSTEGQLNSSAT